MRLKEYLFRNNIKVTTFARRIDVNRNYLNRIVLGHVRPGRFLAQTIELATNGNVKVQELLSIQKEQFQQNLDVVENVE